jgi:pyruvate/2-oxoglutarate dehydrogenase complex dihydrolipoamide dehydrogenase (E3) component
MEKYDIIVIGAGSAGLGCSGVANTLGLKTLLIERNEEYFGGDCTNFGCVPSKALIHIAQQFHDAKKATRFGLELGNQKADMKKVLEYIHEKQTIIRNEEDPETLRKKGIDVVIGEATFADKRTVQVNTKTYTAPVIFLCTGSAARKLDVSGQDLMIIYTNENVFFDCTELPENLVVIGGGPIGCELGQAFSRLGSKVYIVNRGERLLDKEPPHVSRTLAEQFKKEGIEVLNNTTVEYFEKGVTLIKSKYDVSKSIPTDAVISAIGRTVNISNLQLEKAGIEVTDKSRIKVDEYLQSTNKNVYVIGDAAGSYMFSHGAEKMVRQVWRNLLIPIFKKKNTTEDLSWVTFTEPQVAHFGLSEKQLRERNINFHRQELDLVHEDRAIIQEYRYGNETLWLDNNSRFGKKKLLSGSLIAPQAGELIQELELAKHARLSIDKITSRVYPYPIATRLNQKNLRGVIQETYTNWKLKLARTAFKLFNK